MKDPFSIREDTIADRVLHDTEARRWVEENSPLHPREIEYLKPALRDKRIRFGFVLFSALLIFLVGRSAQLQIVEHDYFRTAAELNRLRQIRIPAPRGTIFDRNGIALTQNIPGFQLWLNPADLPRAQSERRKILDGLSKTLDVPFEKLEPALMPAHIPAPAIIVRDNIPPDEIYPIVIKTQGIPGISIETISVRKYPFGPALAHIIGYLGNINESEKSTYIERGYELNDLIGKTGMETAYELQLRGKHGYKYVETNAAGEVQNVLAHEKAIPGESLQLTVDSNLQEKMREALQRGIARAGSTRGAAVILDVQNGEVLALVSLPDYDNNLFTTTADTGKEIQTLLNNPNNPLFPRAIAGTYPSGSTIKPAVAAAALQEGAITARSTFLSVGGLRVSQWFFPDWRAGGHGRVNVRQAIADSVNTFFYIIGGGYEKAEGLGIERLAKYLTDFGIGIRTGIELSGESAGLMPTPKWKEATKNEQWYIGDTYHLAIGQGDILVTPLQVARMTAYFASGGKWAQPHIVMRDDTPDTEQNHDGPAIEPMHIQTVREGMRDAVRYGSALSLSALPIEIAGKTGTAQWSSTKEPHAWFTGWAPYKDAQIAVTVIIEEGGEGSSAAVPVAKEIFEWWFNRRNQ